MYIDSHSHLYSKEFEEDYDLVVQRSLDAKVNKIVLPDIDSTTRGRMLSLAQKYPDMMFPLVGLHPTSVNHDYKKELALIEKELANNKFYGIGECGVDLYWDKTYYDEQVKTFEYQLGLAKELNFPIVIHSRKSTDIVLNIMKKHSRVRGIMHCFPGDINDAKRAIDMGYLLGIGGVVTFKNSGLQDVVRQVDVKHLVLETDAPYLTPVPFRGKRNESSYIPYIAEQISLIKNMNLQEVITITTKNAAELFDI